MFFTREDINKIHRGLLSLSIKDTELPSTMNVTTDDTLAIVQDGKNKQINIKEFFNNISLFKKEAFINITDRFNRHSVSLIEAIQTVPTHQRIDGLVITFEDINKDWRIYQFRGNSSDFFNEDKWTDLYDYTNYIVKSITPDEEDLTVSKPDKNGNAVVSLKDRVYDESNFSGKGYKILRKNIQTINGERKNILTQDMINQPNTVYEIRYDFDLNGEEITIPEGCVLDFQGGSLVNGILKGNILNEHIRPEWFGAKGDNVTDDTESFINTFRLASNGTKVLLRNTIYSVGRLTFENCGNLHIEGESGATLKLNTDRANIIQIEDGQTVVIDNIIFDGNDFKMISNGGGLVQLNGGITKTLIKNCVFQNFKSSTSSNGFASSASRNFTIIENCKFIKCATGPYLSNCTVVSCEFIECHWGCQFSTSSHFVVSNCKFSNNKYGDIYMKTDYETNIDKGIISNNFFTNTMGTSIFISTILPKTTRDNNILINNNVFDLTDNCKVLTLGQINTDDSFYNCNGVIFQNNIVKNCGGLGVIYNANNVRLYNNIVTGSFLNIQGPIKDFIVDGLTIDFKGKDNINFIYLQGHHQTKEWLVDFTIRNFKVINATSFNSIIYQYYENNNDYVSESSTINIENERDSFNAPITYYTNDKLYNKVYFKYITSNLNRYGVKRAFGIGKIIIVGSLLYYWNGETFVKLDTLEMDRKIDDLKNRIIALENSKT